MSPTCDISHGKFYLLSRPGQLMLKKWKKKQCPSANRKSVVLPHIPYHISFLSFYPCYPFPPSFFLLLFPPPSSSSSYPSRPLSVSCTSRRRARVCLGRIHLLWWCIVLLRSFIYCGWPLLNLLLVTEHDKRISSTPLHSSCISQTTQIPHRPCRRETTKPAERITVLVSKSWGRIKHHMLVFSPQRIVQGSVLFKMLLQNCLRAHKRVQCMSGTLVATKKQKKRWTTHTNLYVFDISG